MLKFMVVVYRRPDLTPEEFRRHFEEVHGPLAKKLPGLRKYVQNYVSPDSSRESPGWDAIVDLYFDDRAAMEAAWWEEVAALAIEQLVFLDESGVTTQMTRPYGISSSPMWSRCCVPGSSPARW